MTPSRTMLIELLVALVRDDEEERNRRWGTAAAPFALEYAQKAGQLLLVRDWTADLVLAPDETIVLVDTEYGNPPRAATPWWRHVAWFRGVRHYPELVPLLPARPPDAVTCVRARASERTRSSTRAPRLSA